MLIVPHPLTSCACSDFGGYDLDYKEDPDPPLMDSWKLKSLGVTTPFKQDSAMQVAVR